MALSSPFQWLHRFKAATHCSDRFLAIMHEQLVEQFEAQVNLALAQDFELLPHLPDHFTIHYRNNYGYCEVDLLDKVQNVAYPAEILWWHSNEKPVTPTTPNLPLELKFHWNQLAFDEIIRTAEGPNQQPDQHQAYPFEVIAINAIWPHLTLHLYGTESCASAIETTLANALTNWNTQAKPSDGLIHQVGDLIDLGADHYQIAIDFGSAANQGLDHFLKALSTAQLPLRQVKIEP